MMRLPLTSGDNGCWKKTNKNLREIKMKKNGIQRWIVLAICFLVMMFGASQTYKHVQLVAYWSADLQLDSTQVGMLSASPGIRFFVFAFITPFIMRKIGSANILRIAMFGLAIFPTFISLASSFVLFYMLSVLGGVFYGMVFPATMQLMTNWFPLKETGTANGILMVGGSAMGILLTPLASTLCNMFGWRTQYIIMGCISLIPAILTLIIAENPEKSKRTSYDEITYITSGQVNEQNNQSDEKKSVVKALSLNTILVLLYTIMMQLAMAGQNWVWYGTGVLLGADSVATSLLYSVSTVVVLVYGFIHGPIIMNKLMRGNVKGVLFLSSVIMIVLYIVTLYVPMPWQVWAFILFVFIAICTGPMMSGTTGSYYALTCGSEYVGSIFGIQTSLCSIVGFLFNSVSGKFINYNAEGIAQLKPIFLVCCGASIVSVVILLFTKKANLLNTEKSE